MNQSNIAVVFYATYTEAETEAEVPQARGIIATMTTGVSL
jgi:hypothetical protein